MFTSEIERCLSTSHFAMSLERMFMNKGCRQTTYFYMDPEDHVIYFDDLFISITSISIPIQRDLRRMQCQQLVRRMQCQQLVRCGNVQNAQYPHVAPMLVYSVRIIMRWSSLCSTTFLRTIQCEHVFDHLSSYNSVNLCSITFLRTIV